MVRGKKFKNRGSLNPQDMNKKIKKRFANQKKQEALKINTNSTFVRPIASMYASASAPPIVPALSSAHNPVVYNSYTAMQEEKPVLPDQLYGYIFMCNGKTKPECFSYRVFGLPAARLEVVAKIKPNMKLFLFDFDLRLLYGVYVAASNGNLGLEPTAFGGKFPAQVRFEVLKDCLPLPEFAFKHVIKDNYYGAKFKQELSYKQVNNLVSLFRQTAVPLSAPVAPRLLNAVQPQEMIPSGIEKWVQPPANLPPPDDKHIAGQQPVGAGRAPVYQHVRQSALSPPYEPQGSSSHMTCLQPDVQSQHLPPVGSQRYCELYYPAEAHHPYIPEIPAETLRDLYGRYVAVPKHIESETVPHLGAANDYCNQSMRHAATNASVQAHAPLPSQYPVPLHEPAQLPSSSLTPAYWAAVASKAPNQVYASPYQRLPSGSTDFGAENVSVSLVETNSPAQAQEHAPMPSHSHEPAHLPSSTLPPAYWAAVASEVPSQVYSSPNYQKLSSGSNDLGADNVSVWLVGTNAPAQEHAPMPSHIPAHSHEPAHFPSSSLPPAYWAAVASKVPNQAYSSPHQRPPSGSTPVSIAGVDAPVQAHTPVPLQFPLPSHEPAHLPSTSLPAAYQAAVPSHEPAQLPSTSMPAAYWAAAPSHEHAQLPSTSQTAAYWEAVPSHEHAHLPSASLPAAYWTAMPSHKPTYLPSASLPAAYWAAVAAEVPYQSGSSRH